jgi:25S rRNA (adenine2142-N1)-methyltransferase
MPARKKRALVPPPVKSLKRARQLTSLFHAAQPGVSRAAYQDASRAATARHKTTSRYVCSTLTALGRRPARPPGGPPPRRPTLLEVGAVNTQLLACPWLRTTAIDIRPAARGIEGRDFFDFPLPTMRGTSSGGGRGGGGSGGGGPYDVIVCAMVLNCVATPADRGAMLARMAALMAAPDGLAMLALPRRCVEASPAACTVASFEGAMAAAGLGPVLDRKASAKIMFWTVGVLEEGAAAGAGAGAGRLLPFSTAAGGVAGVAAAEAAGTFAVVVEGGVDRTGGGGSAPGAGGGRTRLRPLSRCARRGGGTV